MRQEIVECKSRYSALKRCPWASVIARVVGGFIFPEKKAKEYIKGLED